jgi:hypothetical protein
MEMCQQQFMQLSEGLGSVCAGILWRNQRQSDLLLVCQLFLLVLASHNKNNPDFDCLKLNYE